MNPGSYKTFSIQSEKIPAVSNTRHLAGRFGKLQNVLQQHSFAPPLTEVLQQKTGNLVESSPNKTSSKIRFFLEGGKSEFKKEIPCRMFVCFYSTVFSLWVCPARILAAAGWA